MQEIVGRFAPTPSGRLHMGNLLCALLAFLSARSRHGRFLLRVEDLDRPRCTPELTEKCIRDLQFLGLEWDGGILFQSRRTPVYEAVLHRLIQTGNTYPCFCTRARLRSMLAPNLGDTQVVYPGFCRNLTETEREKLAMIRTPSIRLRVPDTVISLEDRLQGPFSENLLHACGDFVLRRSDGLFSYQLAVVVDDAESGVTEVVRGRDILSATPRQIYLARLLGYPPLHYVHIPLLMDPGGRRLSKHEHDMSLDGFRERYSREEILGILGCAARLLDRPEPVSLDDLIRVFSWDRIPPDMLTLSYPSSISTT